MSFMIIGLIQYFIMQIMKLFSKSKFSARRDNNLSKSHISVTYKTVVDDECLRGDELEGLMADLGVFSHPGGEKLPEVLSSTYVFGVFEAEEPRLDEVKDAFNVFDENKDGFIDVGELQRVLGVLGFKEGVDMEECRKMIRAFDENADGRIDFIEFVKFMENTLC